MPVCPVCASELEGHEVFCPGCSTQLPTAATQTTDAESTAQWAPPGFDDTEPAGADEDWTVALWGEREPTVVEERVPGPPVVEETIPLASARRRAPTASEWYRNRLVLALIALSVILFVALIVVVLDRNETVVLPTPAATLPVIAVTPQPTNEIPEGERPAVSISPLAVTPAPTPPPTPAAPRTWTQVSSLEGSGPMRGPVFELTGAEARIVHTVQGDQSASFTVFVLEEGRSLQQDGATPVVNQQGPGSDETRLERSAGRYYLDVNSANATWSVTIDELR